ncbi:TadE/TadG family type IV pilus assembly protein [Phenylobacterium sp.]|uniref:TadE/TadG family type IV pilus assembly protein n=1 Tax=Phenylobacterium sp. TaxID=1871053 RepID=UPI0011FDC3C8|nr:TadE/TadG family type IV pilus assembly protein [Phenylobacterium sp.]THD62853.1 MAG: pilus assembly protein [Phenylobacterium sp.]
MRKRSPSRLGRFVARFARAQRGVTAVEFGLVALPLMVLTFGALELALVFLVSTTLDQATEAASRQIRTGNFQISAANTRADFKNLVCSGMSWLNGSCASGVTVDVRTFSTFAALAATPAISPATFNPVTTPTCFTAGQPTDIVLVRTYFVWNLFTPLLNNALENMGGGSGKRLISSTTAFRNEPFDDNPPIGTSC